MSIIYDALKKVEESKEVEASLKNGRLKHSNLKYYVAYFIVVVLGVAVARIIFSFSLKAVSLPAAVSSFNPANKPPEEKTVLTSVLAPDPQAVIAPVVEEPKKIARYEKFVLSGIFYSDQDSYAVVNNRVVKAGDAVDEATVAKINADNVLLRAADGQEIKLTQNPPG